MGVNQSLWLVESAIGFSGKTGYKNLVFGGMGASQAIDGQGLLLVKSNTSNVAFSCSQHVYVLYRLI